MWRKSLYEVRRTNLWKGRGQISVKTAAKSIKEPRPNLWISRSYESLFYWIQRIQMRGESLVWSSIEEIDNHAWENADTDVRESSWPEPFGVFLRSAANRSIPTIRRWMHEWSRRIISKGRGYEKTDRYADDRGRRVPAGCKRMCQHALPVS